MDEILSLALETEKNVPTVFLGPTAAGHLKPPGKILNEGNNAVWHYSTQMESEARKRGMDFLGMYNATLQAGSWDGSFYGESWNLVAAMMVVNWLSRLEST